MTLPDRFIAQGSADEMYEAANLNSKHIEHLVLGALPRVRSTAKRQQRLGGIRQKWRLY